MQYGFKARAKRLALELRLEISLDAHARFEPEIFAELYGLPIYKLTELDLPADVLTRAALDAKAVFSGALIATGRRRIIVSNDLHSTARQRSTLCHEISHVVLEHPAAISLTYDRKCGAGADGEEEADWLAGELLIPYDAALRQAWNDATDEEVAHRFGVSVVHARWRMNQSGARKFVANSRQRHHRVS